jgi:gliding motility-associated-like protein
MVKTVLYMKRIVFFIFLALIINQAKSQVLINEVCWTNKVNFCGPLVPAVTNTTPDYIELYNATPSFTHSLAGYYLTNSKTDLYKWPIPTNLTLGPGQTMSFWCDGRNQKEAGVAGRWHTNFTIEQCQNQWIMLTRAPGVIVDSIFVRRTKTGDTWGHYPDGNNTGPVRWFLFNNGAGLSFDQVNTAFVPPASVYYGYAPTPTFTTPTTAGFTPPNTGNYDMVIPDTVNFQINYTRGDCSTPGGDIPCSSYTGCVGNATAATTYTYQDGITTPIPMNGVTSVITAVTFPKPNGVGSASLATFYLPSFAETNTFFDGIDITVNPGFGVLSIVTNTAFFTGAGASTVHCEYFDKNKFYSEIGGSLSQPPNDPWAHQQRSFDVGFDDETGEGCVLTGAIYNDAVFGTSTRTVFPNFEARTAGKDNFSVPTPTTSTPPILRTTHMRDAFAQTYAMKNGLSLDGSHYKPIRTFVNGCYWGIYEFREILDQDYLNFYYGLNKDSVDILRQHVVGSAITNNLDTGWVTVGPGPSVLTSSLGVFNTVRMPTIYTSPPFYNNAMKRLSKYSFMDFFIYNSYLVNTDMTYYNTSWWRKTNNGNHPPYADTLMKWRYFMWDMNDILDINITPTVVPTAASSMTVASPCMYTSTLTALMNPPVSMNPTTYATVASAYDGHNLMLKNLLLNATFRNEYMNRYQDLMNTVLRCNKMLPHFDYFRQVFTPEIYLHSAYWLVNTPEWENNMDTLRYRLLQRCDKIDSLFTKCNNMNGPYDINIDVKPAGSGLVNFNSLYLSNFIWSGQYYQYKTDNPYLKSFLEAWPTDTSIYVFDHWEFTANTNSTTATPWVLDEHDYLYKDSITFIITQSDNITAVFADKRNDIVMPTGFTPNGDGVNDVFSPLGAQARYARDYEMQVWNRWGQEVFRANEYSFGWDGTHNGQQAQTGVYAYILKYKNVSNEYKVVKGNVTLIR